MAGIEQLEVHSKSYIVRWVKVDEGYTISWSVQPHKKSINFGIVKHPGTGSTNLTTFQSEQTDGTADSIGDGSGGGSSDQKAAAAGLFAKKDASTAQEQLKKKGFILVKWHGKCEADKVSMGTYDVLPSKGGMFGLVFDNTFSKQTSKHATFVLLTYPTGAPPQGAHHLPNQAAPSVASTSKTSLGRYGGSPMLAAKSDSLESIPTAYGGASSTAGGASGRPRTAVASQQGTTAAATPSTITTTASSTNYHVGTLLKRRRKKGQGYARRFFSLDYATCTLSYYHNRNSSALRGAIPLSLAAIAADERRREISIDSGAEVWHLKASNAKEFTDWAHALERASRIARGLEKLKEVRSAPDRDRDRDRLQVARTVLEVAPPNTQQEEDREWQQVEALVSRIVGTRDALRRLVKDIAAQKHAHAHAPPHPAHAPPPPPGTASSSLLSPSTPALSEDSDSYFQGASASASSSSGAAVVPERRSFWKRKSSASALTPQAFQPSLSSALAVPTPSSVSSVTSNGAASAGTPSEGGRTPRGGSGAFQEERSVQDHCAALLGDLDSVVAEFSNLLSNSKRRRLPPVPGSAASRHSFESSTSTEEFFDAAEGGGDKDQSQLLVIDQHSEEEEDTQGTDVDEASIHDSSSVSSVEDKEEFAEADSADSLYPPKPKSLTPLPITEQVERRAAIPPSTVLPPSLIAFVRKNVGKDLSTISMPVSANEPTSLLQRVAEQLEYAHLLDEAGRLKRAEERLMYVTAFAVSQFSGGRAKERAIRKPFNPLLGETYELVRAEHEMPGGLRLLVEKVSHRPVRLAMQADAAAWSFAQAPAPTQKFWGKSAELTTEGRVRVVLRLAGGGEERYSWPVATVFLRNVVMGEKYVEPVGSMHVTNDTTGAKAAVEFRSRGMFGGRSEDVQVEGFGPDGGHAGLSLTGTWTGGLRLVEPSSGQPGREIWRVGRLVDNAAAAYGMTAFAASLNEITPLERGRLPPTDSRLRPDQRLAEEGRLDEAEDWKARLEEAQRRRRAALEAAGGEHRPRWFVKVASGPDGDEVWRLRGGREGYWEERARGNWAGVEDIFTA